MAELAFAPSVHLISTRRTHIANRNSNGVVPRHAYRTPPCAIVGNTSKGAKLKSKQEANVTPLPRFYTFDPSDVEAIRIRHVLVRSAELADTVYEMVRKKSATLAELAVKLSVCEATRDNEGDLGWWWSNESVNGEHGKLGMNDELMGVALRTQANTLSKVTTIAGVHVFIVEDIRHKIRTTSRAAPNHRRVPRDKVKPVVPMSYAIQTLGCQMNRSDSERMAGELERVGYSAVEDPFEAAVVVLNTCSIRDHAEGKVYSYLGRHAIRKRDAPGDVTLCVAGCVAQQEGEKLLRRVPELDLVIGPQYANRLGDLLEDVQLNHTQVAATEPVFIQEDLSKPRRESSITAWVNVIYGCNERCSYCVVPHVRGLEQSRPIETIVAEIAELGRTSIREVVLLGQNIDAYGRDMYPKRTFAELLEAVHEVVGIDRIRFATSHPRYMSRNLISTCARLPKVMPSYHVPPQSGDDEVLKRMKRGYSVKRYIEIVDRIRELIPHASVSGDVIVAFPGETEAQFENTLKLLEYVRFDTLHTAAYSPRPNTDAALYEDQLPDAVKMDRLRRVNELVSVHALERSKQYLGKLEHVLVENDNAKYVGQVTGRNAANRVVNFTGDFQQLKGKIVPVRIDAATPFSISGVQCGDPY